MPVTIPKSFIRDHAKGLRVSDKFDKKLREEIETIIVLSVEAAVYRAKNAKKIHEQDNANRDTILDRDLIGISDVVKVGIENRRGG